MTRISLIAWLLLGQAFAACTGSPNCTVKAGGGGGYTTIQACSTAAVAGDFCIVFAGTYAGWTQAASGSAGNPITFKANAGDAVLINSTIALGSQSYVTVGSATASEGFEITGQISFTTMSHVIVQNNNIHGTSGRCFQGAFPGFATFNQFVSNTINLCGGGVGGGAQGILLVGNNNLIDLNSFIDVEDGIALYGDRNVVRNNHFSRALTAIGSVHPDTLESVPGGGDPPMTNLLYEGNVTQDWGASPGDPNAHIQNVSDVSSTGETHHIWRFNSAANIGSVTYGTDRNVSNTYVYNNSVSYAQVATSGNVDFCYCTTGGLSASNGKGINNIFSNNVNNGGWSPVALSTGSNVGFVEHNNMQFNTGYSGAWKGPLLSVSTNQFDVTDIFNQDPKFVSAGPTGANLHLQAGSPAIQAGGALITAVGSGSTSTALTVADAGYFQDGYGGIVQADWIRIGSTNTVQISSINYSTNVITLATAQTWSNGDSIYLYKKSDGVVVLNGANPDIGAFPFSSVSQVATPTFSPVAGTYSSAQTVTISTATSLATLCYTTDGTTPTANGSGTCTHGTTYSVPVSVLVSQTLKAVGSKSGFTDSVVGSAVYVIQQFSSPVLGMFALLKWKAPFNNVSYYNLYKGSDCRNLTPTDIGNRLSYQERTTKGNLYAFALTAVDDQGHESKKSPCRLVAVE